MRGLIVAGYGGHAAYSYAVAYELARVGIELDIVLPRGYGYLTKRFEKLGKVHYMTLPRKPLEPFYKGLYKWPIAIAESLKLLREKYDFVFYGGSNFSVPPFIVEKFLKHSRAYTIEDHIHIPTKATRLLHELGATVFLHWVDQLRVYPRGVVVGPVYEPPLYEPWDGGYVLVTTGTVGAKDLFDALVELDVEKAVVKTSDVDPEPYAKKKPNWVFFKYVEDMDKLIAGASVVVVHPGVTALTARLAYGKPVVVVYTKRHAKQYTVAEVKGFAEKINAVFVEEANPEKIATAIDKAKKLDKPSFKNGAREIASILVKD